MPSSARYHERLTVPWWWWLMGVAVVASIAVAVGAFLGPWWALLATLGSLGVLATALVGWQVAIQATADELTAGGAHIDWHYVAAAIPLDAKATRERLGRRANVSDWLLVRPYLTTAVEIRLSDRADPHPAWILSTRRPRELADVVNTEVARRRESSPEVGRLEDPSARREVR